MIRFYHSLYLVNLICISEAPDKHLKSMSKKVIQLISTYFLICSGTLPCEKLKITIIRDRINHKFKTCASYRTFKWLFYYLTLNFRGDFLDLEFGVTCINSKLFLHIFQSILLLLLGFLQFRSKQNRPYEFSKTNNYLKSLLLSKLKKLSVSFSPLLKCRIHSLFHENL